MKLKYPITTKLIPVCDKQPRRRKGQKIKVKFIVLHDTGNIGATAKNHYDHYMDTYNKGEASAQLFVDDISIWEVIPAFKDAEQANHVLFGVTTDNKLFGSDANTSAIGIEMCFFKDKIRSQRAYEKTIWVAAYLCYYHKLDPKKHITAHEILDPQRKCDPTDGLRYSGHTYKEMLADILKEYNAMINPVQKVVEKVKEVVLPKTTKYVVLVDTLNIRVYNNVISKDIGDLHKGDIVDVYSITPNGWAKIRVNGRFYYISADTKYVKKI